MRVTWTVAALVVGCSKTPCPDADQLAPGEEAAVIAKRCRLDNWPEDVSTCLKGAQRDESKEETCLKGLTEVQKDALRMALGGDDDDGGGSASAARVKADLHALGATTAARLSCPALADAADELGAAFAGCPHAGELEAYGTWEEAKAAMARLEKAAPQQHDATCAEVVRALRDMAERSKRCR